METGQFRKRVDIDGGINIDCSPRSDSAVNVPY